MRRVGRAPRRPKTRHPSRQRSRVYVRRPKRRRASLSVVKHAVSEKAKHHKSEYDTKFQSTPERVKYREELLSERRKRGIAGKGGPDMSHTKEGTLVAESPHANRARHFKERGTLKSTITAYNQLFEYDTVEKARSFEEGMSRVRSDLRQKRFEDEETPPMTEAEEAQHALVVGSKHGRKGQQSGDDVSNRGRRGRGGRGKGSQLGDSSRSTDARGLGDPPENKRIGRVDRDSAKQHAQASRENLARQNAGPLWNLAHRLISHIEGKMNDDQQDINHDRERAAMQSWRSTGKSGLTDNDDDYWGHIDVRGLLSDELRAKLYKPKLQGGQYVKVRGAGRPSRFHETPMGEDPDVQYRAPRTVRGGQMEYEELQPEDMMEIFQLFKHGTDLHNEARKAPRFKTLQMDLGQYVHHLLNERDGGEQIATALKQTTMHEAITGEMERQRLEGDTVDLDELGAPKATPSSTGLVRVAQGALAREREHETTALDRMRYGGRNPFKPKTEQERALDMVKPRNISVVNDRGRRSKIRAPHHAPMSVPTMFGPLPISTKDIDVDSRREGVGRIGVKAAQPTQTNPITGQKYGADPNVVDVDPSRTISAPDKTKQLGQGE